MSYDELAAALARGETPDGVEILKRSPVRCVARTGDAVLKVFLKRPDRAAREARALGRARERAVPVPEVLASGEGWIATGYLRGREGGREDLDRLLPVVSAMHHSGMLHGDLHLGNVWMHGDAVILLDLQRARFLPFVSQLLRRRELGYLAYSAGEPLPASLGHVAFWRERRAHVHWRSRTKRCLLESSVFTAFDGGFRRRDCDAALLRQALLEAPGSPTLKRDGKTRLSRHGDWILKQHADEATARAAWVGACGLEARGIACARALAWQGRWLVMEDAGPTLIDWIEGQFDPASEAECAALAEMAADLLARLHRRGIYHDDLKANNVCWAPGGTPRLLDYGHVRFGRRLSRRRRIKNLAQLNAALPDPVPDSLRERALQRYLEQTPGAGDAASFREAVIRLSLARRHRWSGCQERSIRTQRK